MSLNNQEPTRIYNGLSLPEPGNTKPSGFSNFVQECTTSITLILALSKVAADHRSRFLFTTKHWKRDTSIMSNPTQGLDAVHSIVPEWSDEGSSLYPCHVPVSFNVNGGDHLTTAQAMTTTTMITTTCTTMTTLAVTTTITTTTTTTAMTTSVETTGLH